MRASDLCFADLLEAAPEGGPLRFAGERALIFDAVALGLLRKELIEALGLAGARGILTRFGYGHGYRCAQNLQAAFPWTAEAEWRRAGARLHALQGIVVSEPCPNQRAGPYADAVWRDSYEAEQHLLHIGQADEAVCWTLTGFASGYLSRCHEARVICIETRCIGRGDALCRIEGRPEDDWEPELLARHQPLYQRGCLEAALGAVAASLDRTERRLRKRRRLVPEAEELKGGLIARSSGMRQVVDLASRAARVDANVLITGESGVGKERLARLIHEESPRAAGPFIAINAGALPDQLVQSELFGHARGAFTGADRERIGLFEAARGGTLFLDEVGEIAPATQVALLRVLQEGEVRRLGESAARPVDARLVAATNRDLALEIKRGAFREDLFYRLKVIEARIPPLRERREDIIPLARMGLRAAAEKLGLPSRALSPAAAKRLLEAPWPGNVRQLLHAIEHAAILARGPEIRAEDLPVDPSTEARPDEAPAVAARSLAEVERSHILAVLEANGGHRARSAAQLGIGVATLYRKLSQYQREG